MLKLIDRQAGKASLAVVPLKEVVNITGLAEARYTITGRLEARYTITV